MARLPINWIRGEADVRKMVEGDQEVAVIFDRNRNTFTKIKKWFGNVIGKSAKFANVDLIPIQNFREFLTVQKKYPRRIILASTSVMSLLMFNATDGDEIAIDLTGFDSLPTQLAGEVVIERTTPERIIAEHKNAVILTHSKSLDAFQATANVDDHVIAYSTRAGMKANFTNNTYMLYTTDVRMAGDAFAALFRPLSTINFLVIPKNTAPQPTKEVQVTDLDAVFDE